MIVFICSMFASSAGPRQPQQPNLLFGHQESHPPRVTGPRQGSPRSNKTGVLVRLAFHADRILRMDDGLADDDVRDDLFHFFFFYRDSRKS